ncbi:hypothetical protein FPQ18DRAFT_304038 [Pyronema domesticum]|nr:hypothetical protein FPQ18DRAFT_304038 [Pyronema domesticum]
MPATQIRKDIEKRNERKRRRRRSNGILKKAGELKGCGVRIYIVMQDETNGLFTIYNSENSTGDSSWPPAPEDINKAYPPPKFVVPQFPQPPIPEIHSVGGRDTEFEVRQPPVLEVRQPPVLEVLQSPILQPPVLEVLQSPILQPPILQIHSLEVVERQQYIEGAFLQEAF